MDRRNEKVELYRALSVTEVEERAQHDIGYLVLISVQISSGQYSIGN